MTAPLLSPHWYRVSALRPRLRSGVRVSRQQVRGETWVLISDPMSGRHHRFDTLAWSLLQRLDGSRSLDELWAEAARTSDAPSQDDTIRLIAQAFDTHLLVADVSPEAEALVRQRRQRRAQARRAALNPLAFRLRLWDPDRFLTWLLPLVRPLYGRTAALACAAWLVVGAVLALLHGPEFAAHTRTLAGSGRFWLLIWLTYPALKAIHELAHGLRVKHHGGEVHAVGVSLLLLTPLPFVDASASAAFEDKRHRAAVAAAGIRAELVLACAGFVAWLLLEPGLARDAAAAVALLGSVSTLLVNGNPLLRFDGYHVLTDWLELPNLATRSRAWWLVLLRRLLAGPRAVPPLREASGERPWLVAYAPLSWTMQATLLVLAVLALAPAADILAALLLVMGAWMLLLRPAFGAARWALHAAELNGRRDRALAACAFLLCGVGMVAFGLPLAHRVQAPGLVWLPDDAFVRAPVDGFLLALEARDGEAVAAGQTIARLHNDELSVRLAAAQADLERLAIEWRQHWLRQDDGAVARSAEQRRALAAEVQQLEQRVASLVLRAPRGGRIVIDPQRVREGQFLAQGELLAQLLDAGNTTVHAFLHNDHIQWASATPEQVRVELADGRTMRAQAARVLPASLGSPGSNAVPQASTALPSAALGEAAGGAIALDPADPKGLTARAPRLRLAFELPAEAGRAAPAIGQRVQVTLQQGTLTPVEWVALGLRRLFLRHFGAAGAA